MKLLSEDTKVVNALKRILLGEDYFYFKYNESKSKDYDFLHVDVIDDKPDNANMHRSCIVEELERASRRFFRGVYDSGPRDTRRGDLDKQWGYFRIRERKKP